MKQPCVYIMASRRNGTLYTGVTSNLPKRAFEHREGLVAGFSKKHACKILVWYELHGSNRSPHERSDMRDRLPRISLCSSGLRLRACCRRGGILDCFASLAM